MKPEPPTVQVVREDQDPRPRPAATSGFMATVIAGAIGGVIGTLVTRLWIAALEQ